MKKIRIALILLLTLSSLYAEPMKYTQDQLEDPALLKSGSVVPLSDESERGLHIGIYGKERFKDLEEFCAFITNISSITQLWYSEGDLEEAYEWYEPDDSQAGWIKTAEKKKGSVKDWIRISELDVDLSKIPDSLNGTYLLFGDSDEFMIAGFSDAVYFEIYLSDLVL